MRPLVAGAVLLALSGTARADEVMVLPPRLPGDFPPAMASRITEETGTRLAAAGLTVRGGADIDTAVGAAADCPDAPCLRDRLGALGPRLAARLSIEAKDGGYAAELEVTTLRVGAVLVHEEADCTGCAPPAAMEVALSLIDGIEIPPADPEPPPAPVPPPVEAALPLPPPTDLVEPPPPRRPSGWAWAAGGAGIALVAVGVPLVLLDGEPTCAGPSHTCPDVYDTRVGGWSLVGLGAGLLAAAVVIAVTGWPQARAGGDLALGSAP